MNKSTLIIGSGKHAILAAETLIEHDINVFLCTKEKISDELTAKENDTFHVFENTRVVSSRGSIGDFHVTLDANGSPKKVDISNILIAEEISRLPSYDSYKLRITPSVIPLAEVDTIINETVTDIKRTAVFLTGISYESHPEILKEIIRAALTIQKKQNSQVYIFTGNLKVAQKGMEAMVRESRKKGVIYVKCADAIPKLEQNSKGTVSITFIDDISCKQFNLSPDTIIVDETFVPDVYLSELSNVFGLDKDAAGFLQTGNVHRMPVCTNVRGILAAGPCRTIQSGQDHLKDIDIACKEILSLYEKKPDENIQKAEIIKGNCIHCLTCFRVCPYQAVSLNTLPAIMPEACEGCGICASQCPRQAIRIEHISVSDIAEKLYYRSKGKPSKTFSPHIIAFCCGRSAVSAYKHARLAGYKIPKGLKIVEVPCGGAISMEHILTALNSRADGVMIVTCHDGNCHGEQGNRYARSNSQRVQNFLDNEGIEKERVKFITIASNMGSAFSEEAISFDNQIKAFERSKIK